MTDTQGILICGEAIDGKITTVTKELVNIGRRLSENINQPLRLLLIGQSLQEEASEIASLGPDVYLVHDVPFAESIPERYVAIIRSWRSVESRARYPKDQRLADATHPVRIPPLSRIRGFRHFPFATFSASSCHDLLLI